MRRVSLGLVGLVITANAFQGTRVAGPRLVQQQPRSKGATTVWVLGEHPSTTAVEGGAGGSGDGGDSGEDGIRGAGMGAAMEKHLVSGKKVERIKREQEAKVASALAGIDGEGNGAAAGRGLKPMVGGKVDKTQLSPWENKQLARERKLRRVNPKIQKRRMFIEANQVILKRKRQAEKEKMRGVRKVPALPKAEEKRLENLRRGQWLEGQVVRLLGYGAWVDVGSNVDGFLHVSAIKADGFVHHPADELTPGQPLRVRVKHVDAEQKVLGLSCLESLRSSGGGRSAVEGGEEVVEEEEEEEEENPARARGYPEGGLALEDVWEDQEMWGEVTRVTHFGCFMEVGLQEGTEGFLHVNDFPERQIGQWAPDIFKRGQRIRTYAKEVDLDYNRLKLTAARPRSLPRVPW